MVFGLGISGFCSPRTRHSSAFGPWSYGASGGKKKVLKILIVQADLNKKRQGRKLCLFLLSPEPRTREMGKSPRLSVHGPLCGVATDKELIPK
jgi:hypothetical protein